MAYIVQYTRDSPSTETAEYQWRTEASDAALNIGVFTMKRKSAEANVTDEAISFLFTPAVLERCSKDVNVEQAGGVLGGTRIKSLIAQPMFPPMFRQPA